MQSNNIKKIVMDSQLSDLTEYEKVLGKPTRVSLFQDDEEAYQSLRQFIIDSPKETINNSRLPFEGVKLLNYDIYQLKCHCENKMAEGKKLFYIKREKDDSTICFAFGYYDERKDLFFLLNHSIINRTDYSDYLISQISDPCLLALRVQGRYVIDDVPFISASQAASVVLGKNVDFTAWIGPKKTSLADTYAKYKQPFIYINEAETLPKVKKVEPVPLPIAPAKEEYDPNLISKIIIGPLLYHALERELSNALENEHVFHLEIHHVCKVSGYYDEETNKFILLRGSMFARNLLDYSYSLTSEYLTRQRLIKNSCIDNNSYYILFESFSCRTASVAASIVIGMKAHYALWLDDKGLQLSDYYPDKFTQSSVPSRYSLPNNEYVPKGQSSVSAHFYLVGTVKGRECEGELIFNRENMSFILLAGSKLANDVTSQYRYTAEEFSRRKFIQDNCEKVNNEIRLKKDFAFDSPDQAANYLLGAKTDGWSTWTNSDGIQLLDYFLNYV